MSKSKIYIFWPQKARFWPTRLATFWLKVKELYILTQKARFWPTRLFSDSKSKSYIFLPTNSHSGLQGYILTQSQKSYIFWPTNSHYGLQVQGYIMNQSQGYILTHIQEIIFRPTQPCTDLKSYIQTYKSIVRPMKLYLDLPKTQNWEAIDFVSLHLSVLCGSAFIC